MNNDQSKLMNPPKPPQMLNQPPPQPQRMNPPRIMNQQSHQIMQQQVMMNNNPLMMNPRGFNINPSEYNNNFGSKHSKMSRNNWKGKRIHNSMYNNNSGSIQLGPGGSGGYKPPTLNELQSQNRLKTKKFYPKKKYGNRYVPYAPRNTTSFIIRAKKSGGIAELVSPCPVTPAVLPTPMFSPSREVLGDMAKEEWGVDGYGSMKGLIRLRSDGLGAYDEDEEDEGGSSESDVEEHVEVERRLDHDLSRFEMIYPSYGGGSEYNNVLENRVDDQDSHIAQLEEENLMLKERLFLMERELGDLRRRMQYLERRNMVAEDANEEVVENESESDGDDTGGSDARTSGDTKVAAEDVCMQDVVVKEIENKKSSVDEVDEAKENKDTLSEEKKSEGKEATEKENRDISGERCEEDNRVAVDMDESKEIEKVVEKLEVATENGSGGEQGTTIC